MEPPLLSSDEPNPDAPSGFAPRAGHCPCCGRPSGKLFAMGHDARFRGLLQRALAGDKSTPPNWNNRVDWFVSPGCGLRVTVTDALAHVARLIGRDWAEKVASGASRLAKRPMTDAPARPVVAAGASEGAFDPSSAIESRIDDLMVRLGRPMAGKWGWLELTGLVPGELERDEPIAGRVVRTHRDEELAPAAWHLDVFVPEFRKTFVNVAPGAFRVDERAKDAS
jgi:hypothetical protein